MAGDKRYQVFVSSTYEDLREERQAVMQALLELDCIPSGMELFPAANEDQWTLIKRVIDDCDYYLVVSGGRYGTTDSDGMGYTEKEYRYALEQGKPVIAFLCRDPGKLEARRTEQTDEGRNRLNKFRELLQKRVCKLWSTPDELGGAASRSLVQLIKTHPAVGWVRADQLAGEDANREIIRLRKSVERLEGELDRVRTSPPPGTDELAQGSDTFEVRYDFRFWDNRSRDEQRPRSKHSTTWNSIFAAVGPSLINEASEGDLRAAILRLIKDKEAHNIARRYPSGESFDSFSVHHEDFGTVIVQLRALGLITMSDRPRSVKDTGTYWKLTPYGDTVMTKLRAIHRAAPVSPSRDASSTD